MTFPTFRLDDSRVRKIARFEIVPDEAELAALKRMLDLIDLRKVRLKGELRPIGKGDWELSAEFGATYVQPCVISLKPVTTRVDARVERLFVVELPEPEAGAEVEMPDDDRLEPRPSVFAPEELMQEVLTLEMPQWPRAEGAQVPADLLGETGNRPFEGLAGLKAALEAKSKP